MRFEHDFIFLGARSREYEGKVYHTAVIMTGGRVYQVRSVDACDGLAECTPCVGTFFYREYDGKGKLQLVDVVAA